MLAVSYSIQEYLGYIIIGFNLWHLLLLSVILLLFVAFTSKQLVLFVWKFKVSHDDIV